MWAGVRLRIVEADQREITALNERLMNAQEQDRIRIFEFESAPGRGTTVSVVIPIR